MRTITTSLVVVFTLAHVLPMTRAADDAAAPSPKTLVGSSPLPEEIEEAQRLAGLAAKLRQQGRLEEAESMYKDALDRNSANTDALGGLAQTYLERGQYDSAALYLGKLLQVKPDDVQAKVLLEKARRMAELSLELRAALQVPSDLLLTADKLSLRILPRRKDFTPAEANSLSMDPSLTPRDGEFIWLDAALVAISDSICSDRGRVLAYNKGSNVILPDGSWSITAATPATDQLGRPQLTVRFDSRGAELFSALTRDNVGRPLAIAIEHRIVSATYITSPLSDSATVAGSFTDDDVMQMLRALLPKKPLTIEARMFELASAEALTAFLHDSLKTDIIVAGQPFTGSVILSEPQAKQLLEWLTSQPTAKTTTAPRLTVFNGEKTSLALGSESRTDVKLSLLPYLVRRNRIWVQLDCSVTRPSPVAGEPNGPAMMDIAQIDTIVTLGPGDQMLLSGPGNSFILIKAALAEQAQTKSIP